MSESVGWIERVGQCQNHVDPARSFGPEISVISGDLGLNTD